MPSGHTYRFRVDLLILDQEDIINRVEYGAAGIILFFKIKIIHVDKE